VTNPATVTRAARILIVEDDDGIRDLVDIVLSSAGYEVLTASDGAAALQVVGTVHPDLVLLDMRMPVMDGWEFARQYRAGPEPHAPIVVLTAARDAAVRAAEISANAYLGKPFEVAELLTLVGRLAHPA
jgi:two-component system, chemotaxis family, chemotaxis protein CheY